MINIFYRFEFKYRIKKTLAKIIESELRHFGMETDVFAAKNPDKSYTVTSLYFDSSSLSDYNDKAGGFLERKKIRARIYEPFLKESQFVWIEMKQKHDTAVKKERISLTPEEWQMLKNGRNNNLLRRKDFEEKKVLENIQFHILSAGMLPKTITRYERIPLVYRHVEPVRITFDSSLEACENNDLSYNQSHTQVLEKDEVIMELKFRTLLPLWLRDLITSFNLERVSYSKYAQAAEALRQYVPIPR